MPQSESESHSSFDPQTSRRVGNPPSHWRKSHKRRAAIGSSSSSSSTDEDVTYNNKSKRRSDVRHEKLEVKRTRFDNSSPSSSRTQTSAPKSNAQVGSKKPRTSTSKSPRKLSRHVKERRALKTKVQRKPNSKRRVSNEHNDFETEQLEDEEEKSSLSSESEDDDTDSMDGIDPSWTTDIMNAYKQARDNFERMVDNEGLEPYRRAIAIPRVYRLQGITTRVPELNLQRDAETKKRIQPNVLEWIEPLPPMIYWTLTEMNIKAEDEFTLSHVPYMGDHVDEDKFCKELMETFPDGIHGTKQGCGEYINDFILYYTVKHVEQNKPQIPMTKLFRLIYEQFPNKTQKHELEEVYPDLRARFEPHLVRSAVEFDDNGLQRVNVTPESLLHTYEVLQCHRCALYDCPHHNSNLEDHRPKRHIDDPFTLPAIPCGGDCYLKRLDASSPSPSKTSALAQRQPNGLLAVDVDGKRLNGTTMKQEVTWSPQEESMMALMRSVGINDCCMIARVLLMEPGATRAKTCEDVYQYFRRQGPLSPKVNVVREPPKKKKDNQVHRAFRAIKWLGDGAVKNNYSYIPCNHDGPCDEQCGCFQRDKICTKYCACYANDCKIQFPGCRCSAGNCRTKQCPCYYASWECDPDNCKSCHCAPEDESQDPNVLLCKNVCFQRGLQKKLSVRPSQVAGWGCYAEEPMNKNDFVSEYCGEIVSLAESERRGKIYDKNKSSYLFKLNQDYEVDATRKGNLIRFANHSSNPNCYAKVVVVNTEHRIGIFASRTINPGEELFFNYAYSTNHQLTFLNRELDRKRQVVIVNKDKKAKECKRSRKPIK
ncbi:[histone H3]-lysine(27) N-trimethyltransferase [Aphelenchoides besseyi]|nr:[histone H3]-lysine(27) N-trimethyltransferase [Aphelenchoides besseyi]